ncbi:unnamed protein product [Thelazia callipaeda]|uniref:DM10 domain-containing protein n=1 Tax=Thelazia callipaeda TaxID=103827 RepID=A0A0N5CUC2_THECL|nr:unnamed protein product [Thelazia callipaeda]
MDYLQMEDEDLDVLSFECYSFESESQTYPHLHRIKPMKLLYHLKDHTSQIFTHQKVLKLNPNHNHNYLHWSDLNVAKNVNLFSKVYRITACDHHTRDFLSKNGIEVNEEEEIPMDTLIQNHDVQQVSSSNEGDKNCSNYEEVNYSNAPNKLHLLACWLDNGSVRIFHMIVHTIDDTVALVENIAGLKGQLFLKRNRLPCVPKDGRRFYRCDQIRPGLWIEVYTRPMFIFSCEGSETRNFLARFGPIDFKDYEKILLDGPSKINENPASELKFIAAMVGGKGLFEDMKFLVTIHVDKQELSIAEADQAQKWQGGRIFLEGINANTYSMEQYKIGSILKVYRWRFRLLEADDTTQQYLFSRKSQ